MGDSTSIDVVCRVAGSLADRQVSKFVLARARGGSRDDVFCAVPGEGRWRPIAECIGAIAKNIGIEDRELIREALWQMALPRISVQHKSLAQKAAAIIGL